MIMRLLRENERSVWPVRKVYIKLLESAGKVLVLPLVTAVYLAYFGQNGTPAESGKEKQQAIGSIVVGGLVIALFTAAMGFRQSGNVLKSMEEAMKEVELKANQLKDLSSTEVLLFWFLFTTHLLCR